MLNHLLFDFSNCLGRIEAFRAGFRAVHDRMATIQAERVLELFEAAFLGRIACVTEPAPSLDQHSRAEEFIGIPPIAGA